MNLPPDVQCLEEAQLLIWRPRGVLDEARVDSIISFVAETENKLGKSFNRFTDFTLLDAVDLRFKYVFQVALARRLSRRGRAPLKSAFLVTNSAVAHYLKTAAVLTDHSPLNVMLFETREAAAQWLGVAPELLAPEE
jgi:hypothetical protein